MVKEVFRGLPFPYPDSEFPADLGAVVQTTVGTGEKPALYVVHTPDNDWLVGDGIGDPNEAGACTVMCIWHVIERNSSVGKLADLPIGWQADRSHPGTAWRRSPFVYADD
jgi:hypothetical protein